MGPFLSQKTVSMNFFTDYRAQKFFIFKECFDTDKRKTRGTQKG